MTTSEYIYDRLNFRSRLLQQPAGWLGVQVDTRSTGIAIVTAHRDLGKDTAISFLPSTHLLLESDHFDMYAYRVADYGTGFCCGFNGELVAQYHVDEELHVPGDLIERQSQFWDFDPEKHYEISAATQAVLFKGMTKMRHVVRLAPLYRVQSLDLGRAIGRAMRAAGLDSQAAYEFLWGLDCAAWGGKDVQGLVTEIFQEPPGADPFLENFVGSAFGRELKRSFSDWSATQEPTPI